MSGTRVVLIGVFVAIATFALIMLVGGLSSILAYYQPGAQEIAALHSPDEREFIKNLIVPGSMGVSCCNDSDCHVTDESIEGTHYEARVGRIEGGAWVLGPFVPIPDAAILKDMPKTGKHPGYPIICETSSYGSESGQSMVRSGPTEKPSWLRVYCFIAGVKM